MKVGTDGTLLGAWAKGGSRILDIGTGTGVVALMMAQRFPEAHVTAIDCDEPACRQASSNVAASPFARRISIYHTSLQNFIDHPPSPVTPYHAIVCNPPFFENALLCPSGQRTTARHAITLSYRDLFQGVARMLAVEGEFSAIIPFDCRSRFEEEAIIAGLFPSRVCAVHTTERKPARRYLLAFRRPPVPAVENVRLVVGGAMYQSLLQDFLLRKVE